MKTTVRSWTTVIGCVALGGCGATSTASPYISASAYEAKAESEQREADAERKLFEPGAVARVTHCAAPGKDADDVVMPCWTADHNPTQQHLAEAKRHREAAARFRAESQALRDAEARACAGLSDHDRDTSPFAHTEDIIDIAPLEIPRQGSSSEREGAVFAFRVVPGMTAPSLQRVVDCHLARNDAMGHVAPDMAYCPLVPPNVKAVVKSTPAGLAVEVSSEDHASIADIARRATALQARRVQLAGSGPERTMSGIAGVADR